jgi:microcystin-dependent protein
VTSPFIGEVRMFGGNFAPVGWNMCDGSTLSINQFQALFTLIGTTYGGDGQTTFQVPDLRGRFPVHQGTGAGQTAVIGQVAGTETVTLSTSQLPSHNHPPSGSSAASSNSPANLAPAAWAGSQYSATAPTAALAPSAISFIGDGGSHENRSPYLAISFIIALVGIFPSQG